MFCPECDSLMLPDPDALRCRSCGTIKDKSGGMKSVSEREESDIPFLNEDKDLNTLPTAEVKCDECGYDRAGWWLRQMRSADESETRFYRCLECGNTWREYD